MIFFALISFLATLANATQLLSVVVLHRHGDRNPLRTYKNDPYKDELHWPEGFGQLTEAGVKRQHELGVWLRQRYRNFLPLQYSPKNIRAQATDVDRTLMSAQVTLAGLYPPIGQWNQNINFQPIPIHTARPEDDPYLAMKKQCKKFDRLFKNRLHSTDVVEFLAINKDLYEFLSDKTGQNITTVEDVEYIFNILHTQHLANKSLPHWALSVYPEKLKPSVALRFRLPCSTPELARLRTGLFFGMVVNHFKNIVQNSVMTDPTFLLFSGHDSTLSDVLTTMKAFNDEIPPYSSAIMIELYHNKISLENYVNVIFKNTTGYYAITLESCLFDCEFPSFVKIFEPIIQPYLSQWESECEN